MHVFHLADEARAKRVARALQAEFKLLGIDKSYRQFLDMTGEVYGFDDWQDTRRDIGRSRPSPLDHESDDVVVAARKLHGITVLIEHGVPADVAAALLDRIRPTASHSQRRIEDTEGRFTYLDLPGNKTRPFRHAEAQLFGTLLSRELFIPAYMEEIDWTSRRGRMLIQTGPMTQRLLSVHLAGMRAKTTCGPVILAAALMKDWGEPLIWADTLKEIERRIGGSVSLVKWSELEGPEGVPSDDGIREAIILRMAKEKSRGHPVHRHEIRPGEIGIVVDAEGIPSFSARFNAKDIDAFQTRVGEMVASSFPRIFDSRDRFVEAQREIIRHVAEKGDAEAISEEVQESAGGLLLWMALNHPSGGPKIKDGALEMAQVGGTACITMSYYNGRFLTSLGPDYADLTFVTADVSPGDIMEVMRKVENDRAELARRRN